MFNKKLIFLIFIISCENPDFKQGKKLLQEGLIDDAITFFNKIPAEDKNYNESIEIINKYFQSNIEIRKLLLSSGDNFLSVHPSITKSKLSQNFNNFTSKQLVEKISSIMVKKDKDGEYIYSKYPMLIYKNDVMEWTNLAGGYRDKNVRRGAVTTLIFKQNGKGQIFMEQGPSKKDANLKWSINNNKIKFKITDVEVVSKYGIAEYPSEFSRKFKNNNGEIGTSVLINQSFNASDREEYYKFQEEIKEDFIKYISPVNITDWNSSPLQNDGSLRK